MLLRPSASSVEIPRTRFIKDHTVVLNLLAKLLPSKALSLLPTLLAPVRRGRDLSDAHANYARSLLKFATRSGISTLRYLPTVIKYAICIVFLVNVGSWPFVWHIRVFWPIFETRLQYWALVLKYAFISKEERARALFAWGEDLSPVGANPFEFRVVYKRRASIDDIDMFGMHLSNSSYAKAFDSVRVRALVHCFPAFGRGGGHMALGATHYHFLREIPPLVKYEVRLSIGSWDHKWLYLVARYVSRSSGKRSTPRSSEPNTPFVTSDVPTPAENELANVEHAIAAMLQADNIDKKTGNSMGASPVVEPDGATLHCVAISQICFKWGRITVPPVVVLASDGFTKPCGDGEDVQYASARPYSRTNPPPNWIKSQLLRVPPHGSMSNFRDFLRGKWREVPEAERWWEEALGGSMEAKRLANLEILESLRLGLERTRTLQ